MSIISPKGRFGMFSLLALALIAIAYYAWDKTQAYDDLQQSYHKVKNGNGSSIIQEGITEEETKIAKGLIQGSFDDLWGGMDTAKLLKYHTPDYFILEHGEVWTNKEVMDFMRNSLNQGSIPRRVNRMKYHTIEKHGEGISVAYDNFGDFYTGDSLTWEGQWLESALIIPTDDGWRIRNMHSTRVQRKK